VVARNDTRGTVLAEHVEVGRSLWAKFWGLMGRKSLPAGHALWLPGDSGIHMFFMRFPIDAVFLGRDGAEGHSGRVVVAVRRSVRPWTGLVPFIRGADGVLELPVGTIEATATEPGDVVRFG
jgi:uncharacterized membrane protein (UPF0127 family)